MKLDPKPKFDLLYWVLALFFGAACGYTHIRIQDSSLSVLMVTGFTMFLSYKRPQRVWTWAILMGLSMPVAGLVALLTRIRPSRGMIAGTFAGMAFAIVAAVGGRVLHRSKVILFPGQPSKAVQAGHASATTAQVNQGSGVSSAPDDASNRIP